MEDFQFTMNDENRYETSFTSEGPVTIQIEREESGFINVYGNIEGMSKRMIGNYGNEVTRNAIFVVDVPAGVEVTIESFVEVKQAKMLSNE